MKQPIYGLRRLACALLPKACFGQSVAEQAPLKKAAASCRTPNRCRGLTLIEVMLAVVILGIGSGVLMLATSRCLAVISKSRHYSTAQRLILQVGAEHPLNRAEIKEGTLSGTFHNEDGYSWEREIVPSENENLKGMYTVRTRVSWSDRKRNNFEETVTWYYIPPEEEK